MSLIKLYLCHLWHEHHLIGVWDRVNTEIFLKVLRVYTERGIEKDLNLLVKFVHYESPHTCKDIDLFEIYFSYDQDSPDPYVQNIQHRERGRDKI